MIRAPGLGQTPPVYNKNGLVQGPKFFIGTATTNASGQWTVDLSAAGFTTPPTILVEPISPSNAALTAYNTIFTAPTMLSVSGQVFQPNPVAALGALSIAAAGAGITVNLLAVGF